MSIKEGQEYCVLCGETARIDGFTLATADNLLKFCCAGCLSIYQLLYEDNPFTKQQSQQNEETPK